MSGNIIKQKKNKKKQDELKNEAFEGLIFVIVDIWTT